MTDAPAAESRPLLDVVAGVRPLDDRERADQSDTVDWIGSGSPIYRTAKPATPPKHLVSYSVLVDPARSSLLLVDHRDAGRWLATGGHVGVDEDPAAAARRELREELGLSPPFLPGLDNEPLFVTVTVTEGISAGHTDVSLWYVFAGSQDDELRPDPFEFSEVRWWPIDQVRHTPGSRFDTNLPRFVAKLRPHLESGATG